VSLPPRLPQNIASGFRGTTLYVSTLFKTFVTTYTYVYIFYTLEIFIASTLCPFKKRSARPL
jgi:hypothetical protein